MLTAQTVEAVEYNDLISTEEKNLPNECPRYDIKQSDAGALGNSVYPFIAIVPRSTLAQIGSTWKGTIYELHKTVWHLNRVQTNDLR